jgi:hypothetical protein
MLRTGMECPPAMRLMSLCWKRQPTEIHVRFRPFSYGPTTTRDSRPHEVNVPGLLLRFRICRFLRPFRLRLHCQFRLAPVSAASTLQARCGITAKLRRLRLQLPLPSGSVTSLGIGASTGFAACQSAFRSCPISARSPLPFSIASLGFGSSFPVRYCPVGLLFLKPLSDRHARSEHGTQCS